MTIYFRPITSEDQYYDPEIFFHQAGVFWIIAARAATSYANYELEIRRSWKKQAQNFIPRRLRYPCYELKQITQSNMLIEPVAFSETDIQNAMQALEKSNVPDALWAMLVTGMISQEQINDRTSSSDIFSTQAIFDRVLISR